MSSAGIPPQNFRGWFQEILQYRLLDGFQTFVRILPRPRWWSFHCGLGEEPESRFLRPWRWENQLSRLLSVPRAFHFGTVMSFALPKSLNSSPEKFSNSWTTLPFELLFNKQHGTK